MSSAWKEECAAIRKDSVAGWLWWASSCLRSFAPHGAMSVGLPPSRLPHCPSLESELRPQPLSPCQGRSWCCKYLCMVRALCSINVHIFPYVECFIFPSLEGGKTHFEAWKMNPQKRRTVVCQSKNKKSWTRSPNFPTHLLKSCDA